MLLRKEQLLSRLHFFIFGATIVGETAVTSLIVSEFGSNILGNLYFLNGAMLLFLPILFFKKIDSVNRGTLLKRVLKTAPAVIAVLFLLYAFSDDSFWLKPKHVLILFYPISYLLKTILFLTFWIMAADVSDPAETKTIFPRIAAAGFFGGLSGALLSWGLLHFLSAEYILIFWGLLYVISFFSVQKIIDFYNDRLIPKEAIPSRSANHFQSLFADTKDVFKNMLVRNIAILHFGIFVSIFLVDFHFWQQCSTTFSSAGKLSQFQYGFYVFHSLITIILLRTVTPDLIALRGFTRIFSYLPLTLFIGAFLYANVMYIFGPTKFTFALLLVWQLFRYLAFENFFSPIYQMFFAAVEKEKRGRAKTVVEGLVKPLAIMSASLILFFIGKSGSVIVLVVGVLSFLLFLEALKIKHAYMKSLVQSRTVNEDETAEMVANIGSDIEKDVITILNQFALFSSQDMKRTAIKLLVRMDRDESSGALNSLVMSSSDILLVRETARYAGEIRHNFPLVKFLVEHPDPKVWHRAVLSTVLNQTHQNEFREYLRRFFWVGEPEDRVYAGIYLCRKEKSSDLPHLKTFLGTLLNSEKHCSVELAVLAYTVLHIEGWADTAVQSLSRMSPETAKIAVRHLVESKYEIQKADLILLLGGSEHDRNRELLFREMYRQPISMVNTVNDLLRNSRISGEYSGDLIRSLGSLRLNGTVKKDQLKLDGIRKYAESLLDDVYILAGSLHMVSEKRFRCSMNELAEIVLKEMMMTAAETAVDTLALLDDTGLVSEGRRELRIEEEDERSALIELLEASRDSKLKDFTIPILECSELNVYAELAYNQVGEKFSLLRLLETEESLLTIAVLSLFAELKLISGFDESLISKIEELALSENQHVRLCAERLLETGKIDMSKNETLDILNRVLFLKKNELFAPVSAARLIRLAEGLNEIIYQENDLISREGDRANHLYLIKEGTADIVIGLGREEAVTLGSLRSGDAYGEVGLFNQDIRSASVTATSRCRVYVFSRSYLRKMVSQIPELANTFLQVFGRKLQASHDDVVRLQISSANKINK